MVRHNSKIHLIDLKQNYFQLAAIQTCGIINLPLLLSSIVIASKQSLTTSFLTVLSANILLWVFRYCLLKLSFQDRKSTLDLTMEYFGNLGTYIISLILLIDTLGWFFLHTSLSSNCLSILFNLKNNSNIDHFVQISIVIGVLSTLLCSQGIKSLKRISIILLPIIFFSFLGILFFSLRTFSYPKFTPNNLSQLISIEGLGLILSTNLGLTADLPTFFRHRNTWNDSLKALGFFQFIGLIAGIFGLFLGNTFQVNPITNEYSLNIVSEFQKFFLILFLLFSTLYSNIYNIYSSSVGWEILAPKSLVGRKEYMIIGLGLTILFISFYGTFSLENLLVFADSAMTNLCLLFMCFFLISYHKNSILIYKSKASHILFIFWLLITFINSIQVYYYQDSASATFYKSFSIIFLALLIAFGFKLKNS
jgi:purine-cytosine permease-like protein